METFARSIAFALAGNDIQGRCRQGAVAWAANLGDGVPLAFASLSRTSRAVVEKNRWGSYSSVKGAGLWAETRR